VNNDSHIFIIDIFLLKIKQDLFNNHNRFPWESAATGVEVTPDCCPETRKYQLHITGDISFAARQYLAATNDINWLIGENYSFPLDVCFLFLIIPF